MSPSSTEKIVNDPAKRASKGDAKPRICMPTFRGFTRRAFRCGLYEAQDVLVDTDDVDLIFLETSSGLSWKKKWQKKLMYHDFSGQIGFANPGLRKLKLAQEYDLFIALCQDVWDIPYVNAISGWKNQCKTSICFLDEIWASSIADYKHLYPTLRQFDHIFVGYHGSVEPLQKAIGRPCHWLPGGVDTLRFGAYPNPVPRVIDVYSMGRRWEGVHRALLSAAGRREMFYMYDTFQTASDRDVADHREHRELYANLVKRSHYFPVAPGKMGDINETGGQMEVGYRYFEGAAAGTVMIGQEPKGEAFGELFPWRGAVVKIQPDGSDVLEVLNTLNADPRRMAEISQTNVRESLLRHDWVYRWEKILKTVGVELSPAMTNRKQDLKNLAEQVPNA